MSVGDGALVATAVIAGVALVYASRQLRDSRRTARQEMTYRYLERINSLAFAPALAAARAFWILEPGDDAQARWDVGWETMRLKQKHRLAVTLNLLEELGAVFNQGLLDEPTVRRTLSSASLAYWDEAHWLVALYRSSGTPDVMVEWERMNEVLRVPQKRRFGLGEPWGIASLWGPSAGFWGS